MRSFVRLLVILTVVTVFGLWVGNASAIPSAQAFFSESSLGGGLWQYNYTFLNTSDPAADAGSTLYDMFLQFDSSHQVTVVSLPSGWDNISGLGFVDAFSLNPGAPLTGTDIAPGASLSGFVFQFNYQAGPLAFTATLVNPLDEANPFVYDGTSSPAPVPIPSVLLLLGPGLVGLMAVRRRFKR